MDNYHLWEQFINNSQPKPKAQPKTQTKVVIPYYRVSSKKQEDGASLEVQKEAIEEYCAENDMIIERYFGFTSESAKTDDRKEFTEMLTYVRKNHKRIYGIVVYTLDRFSRSGAPAITLVNELRDKYNVLVISASEKYDITTMAGSFAKDIELLSSNHENVKRRFKCTGGIIKKLKNGYWTSKIPTGYTNLKPGKTADKHEIVINEEGEILRKAFEWKAQRVYTDVEICRKLNLLGLKMNEKRLSWIFRNPFYCGLIINHMIPGQVIKAKHPALISEEMFLHINGIILSRRDGNPDHREKVNDDLPLKGFAKCAETQSPLTGYLNRKKGIYYYKSREKGKSISKNANQLHELFMGVLKDYHLNPDLATEFQYVFSSIVQEHSRSYTNDLIRLKQNRTEKIKDIEAMEERFVTGKIPDDLFEKYVARYKTELNQLEVEISKMEAANSSNLEKAVEKVTSIAGNICDYWQSSDYHTKQQLQYLIFPGGMFYDKKNDVVLTPEVNSVFSFIPLLKGGTEGTKKKGMNFKVHPSDLVGATGFEPVTPCL